MRYVLVNYIYARHIFTKRFIGSSFNEAVIDKISRFYENCLTFNILKKSKLFWNIWKQIYKFLLRYRFYGSDTLSFSENLFLSFTICEVLSRVMGPLLAHVFPCFRKNVIVTSKIVFLFLQFKIFLLKNVIVFIFGKQILKWRLFEKRAVFDLLFIFLVTREKTPKYLTYINTRIYLTLLIFIALPILQKLRIYHGWFLFDATTGVDSYSRHFGAINK